MHSSSGFTVLCLLTSGLRICQGSDPPGHQKPLGAHMSPMGITVIGKFSTPSVFYEHFVKLEKPILMKQPLVNSQYQAFFKWDDYYFRERYGGVEVTVETSKKERRNQKPTKMMFTDFLNIYQREDVYMVHRANEQMMEDIHVPVTLQCGGFERVLQGAVLWFSGGHTRSVLHYDVLDNLLCVLDGSKQVLLINKTYSHLVEAHGFDQDGMYSRVDVDSVNMKQFPRLQKVPWYQARMQAGDCLYIPFRWYHQVKSAPGRNLAVNIWFSHLWHFDQSDCDTHTQFNLTVPMSTFGLASPNEQVRSSFLELFYGLEEVNKSSFLQRVPAEQKPLEQLFAVIDRDKNSVLTWKELYLFDIDDALRQFPNVFHSSILEKEKKKTESQSENPDGNPDDDNTKTMDGVKQSGVSTSQMDAAKNEIDDKTRNMGTDDKTRNMGTDDKTRNMGTDDKTRNMGTDDKTRNMGTDDKTRSGGKSEKNRNSVGDIGDKTVNSELKSTIKVKVTPKVKVKEEKQDLNEKRSPIDPPLQENEKHDEL